jgi:aminomethyltransferase
MENQLLSTSLTSQHIELGAKMAPFAGFNMPVSYKSTKDEVIAVRNSCGVFDVSHMGEFFVTGPDAISFVDSLLTNDFAGAPLEKAVYSPLCNHEGKVIDDLIAYKLENEKVLICVNASNIEKDFNWITKQYSNENCEISNQSDDYSLLAVQGPDSEAILKELGVYPDHDFPYYSAKEFKIGNDTIILARTGYTGEDGFEVFGSHSFIKDLWPKLLEKNVVPCGLASRDVLRIEVGYPLYGHELTEEWTPLDAALKWTVKMDKENFVGKEALASHKRQTRLVKLSLDKGIPRAGYEVLNDQEEVIGTISSGTMSIGTGKGICLALIKDDKFPENKSFSIRIRKNIMKATYHTKAFVIGGHK